MKNKPQIKIASLTKYQNDLLSFMLPANFIISSFWFLTLYFAFGILISPIMALMAIGLSDPIMMATLYIYLSPISLLLVYSSFKQFKPIMLSLSALFSTIIFGEIYNLLKNKTSFLIENNQDLFSTLINYTNLPTTSIIFYIYLFLFVWYYLKINHLQKENLYFRPLTKASKTSIYRTALRYGFFSNKDATFNILRLTIKLFYILIITILISIFFILIGIPHYIASPSVIFFYGAPKYREAFNKFKRNSAQTASSLYKKDDRPRILFLRSFGVDTLNIPQEKFLPSWLRGKNNDYIVLEEVLVDVAFSNGPVGAASDPSAKLKPIGAAREQLEHHAWKDYVLSEMKVSQRIIFILGETPSLTWELEQAYKKGYLSKIVFIFPPRWKIHADNEKFYKLFTDVTGFSKDTESPVALFFIKKMVPLLLVANDQSEREYKTAMQLAFATPLANSC